MKTIRPNLSLKRTLSVALSTTVLMLTMGLAAPSAWAASCTPGPGADLTGCNLHGANLQGADLSNATIVNADLIGADLTGVNFAKAKIDKSDFTNANLSDSDFSGANVTKSIFTGAQIQGSKFIGYGKNITGGLQGTPASYPSYVCLYLAGTVCDYQIINGYLAGPGTDLTDADLSNQIIVNGAFVDSDLTRTNFSNSTFIGDQNGELPQGLGAMSAIFDNSRLIETKFTDAFLSHSLIGLGGNTKIFSVDFSGANLGGCYFGGAEVGNIKFNNAYLAGARISNFSNYTDNQVLDFSGADIKDAYLVGDLPYRMKKIFTGANVERTNLSLMTSSGITSGQVTGTPAKLAPNTKLINGYFVGAGANLSGADLSKTVITNISLADADLSNTDFTNADLFNLNLSNANLSNSNLTNTYLRSANFTGTKLTGSTLANTNLQYTTLDGVQSGSISGTPKGLSASWKLVKGYLVGPKADLTGADLTGADLTGADLTQSRLSNANLTSADLTGAKLSKADIYHANFTGATLSKVSSGDINGPATLPSEWKLVRGYLVGPGADLSYANLSGTDLSGLNLSNTDLNSAQLIGAKTSTDNLGADFSGAILDYANLTDADLSYSTFVSSSIATNLLRTNISHSDLHDAKMNFFTHFDQTIANDTTGGMKLPSGYSFYLGYIIGPNMNLSNANLRGGRFGNLNLTGSDITGAHFEGASWMSWNYQTERYDFATCPSGLTSDNYAFNDCTAAKLKTFTSSPAPTISGTLKYGNTLTVNPGTWDLGTTFTYQWATNGTPWYGATGTTFTPDRYNINTPITVTVTAQLAGYKPVKVTSAPVSVGLGDLTIPIPPSITGNLIFGNTLTIDQGRSDQNATVTTQWTRDGQVIPTSPNMPYTITLADVGHSIGAKYSLMADGYNTYSGDIPERVVAPANLVPSATPSISGNFTLGSTLTFNQGSWVDGAVVTAQWTRDGQLIPTSPSMPYTITAADAGHIIGATYSVSKSGYNTYTGTITGVTVALGTLTLTPTPTISGTVKTGNKLTAIPGKWDTGVTLTYQWLRNGVAISGATSSTYPLVALDVSKNISVQVTGSLTGYTSVSKTSATVKPLAFKATLKKVTLKSKLKTLTRIR
mgnify:CR=1 FL=1